MITIKVSFWSESKYSYWMLTEKRGETWSNKVKFSKSQCQYDKENELLTLPLWLHKRLINEAK